MLLQVIHYMNTYKHPGDTPLIGLNRNVPPNSCQLNRPGDFSLEMLNRVRVQILAEVNSKITFSLDSSSVSDKLFGTP